jgi:hypothetical protein
MKTKYVAYFIGSLILISFVLSALKILALELKRKSTTSPTTSFTTSIPPSPSVAVITNEITDQGNDNNQSELGVPSELELLQINETYKKTSQIYSDLNDKYEYHVNQGDLDFDIIWISNWNKQLRDLNTDRETVNKNDPLWEPKYYLGMAIGDLHTLGLILKTGWFSPQDFLCNFTAAT